MAKKGRKVTSNSTRNKTASRLRKELKKDNSNTGGAVENMPRKKMETRNQSKRAASKEAMKQMQLLSSAYNDDDETETLEITSDDDTVNFEMPPKKKYRLSHRKSSDGNDRDVLVLKSINYNDDGLKLDVWEEDLSPSQKALHLKHEQEIKEMNARIEHFVKQAGAEVIYQSEGCSAYQVTTTTPGGITVSNVQSQNILVQTSKSNNNQNSYQLVMDPRLGLIVGTMTPTTGNSMTPQIPSSITTTSAPLGTRQTRKRGRNSLPIMQTVANAPSIQVTSKQKLTKPSLPATVPVNKLHMGETSSVGGISATPQKTISLSSNSIVDLTSDDARSIADTREVSFNKLQGKTFPSLVVVARPHLRVKDSTGGDRSKLDSKVKAVLMHIPTKFTEWLIQQGLVRSEQICRIHPNSKLKLGMYSDATKFPYSGGYVWISDCCPQRFVSVFSGSLFEGSPHPPSIILKLIYHWACQTNVQNVVQWVKVDNLYVKGLNTWLRALCTVALHTHVRPLGGPMKKVEVGVISLGTTSQDGHQRQVKVEVLGLLETDNKLIRLRAVEPLADGDRNYKKRFSKILEPILHWVHPESLIVTDLTVDKSTLHSMGFDHVIQTSSVDGGPNNNTIMDYLRKIVPRMFQNTLSLLSRQIIQQFLDELVWREWFGVTACQAFDNIILHLSEQTRAEGGNSGQSLIMRLNKVASNPFKMWNVSHWNSNIIPSTSKTNDAPLVKRVYSRQQRKITTPKAASPAPEIIRPPKAISPDVPEQMVPLENYYYGTIEGKMLNHDRVTLKLKCTMCKATFSNNIVLMTHLFFHAHNVHSSEVKQCRYCLTIVTSTEGLNKHMTTSHPFVTRFADGYACVICESCFPNPYSLGKHMSKEHNPAELPYQCGTCGYQCSSHKQAIDHFYTSHAGGSTIQCPFCLKSLSVANNGRMLPQNLNFFLQHLMKHQKKALAKKCAKCALWFIQKDALKEHQTKMHQSQRRKPGLVPLTVPRNSLMVPKSKQDHRPQEEELVDLSSLRVVVLGSKLFCKECKFSITSPNHYPSLESCSNNNCQYSTCCKYALKQHDKVCRNLNASLPVQNLPFEMFCVCGFSSLDGNILAKHLAECERKSAYPSLEAATKATVTHSMLDVLGLVRRPEEPQNSNIEIVDLDKDEDKVNNEKSSDNSTVIPNNLKPKIEPGVSPVEGDKNETAVILDEDSSEAKKTEKLKENEKQVTESAISEDEKNSESEVTAKNTSEDAVKDTVNKDNESDSDKKNEEESTDEKMDVDENPEIDTASAKSTDLTCNEISDNKHQEESDNTVENDKDTNKNEASTENNQETSNVSENKSNNGNSSIDNIVDASKDDEENVNSITPVDISEQNKLESNDKEIA